MKTQAVAHGGLWPRGVTLGRSVLVGLALVLLAGSASAQTTGFVPREFRDDAGAHKYTVFLPRDYHRRSDWPVILYLHGASERGADGRRPTTVGLGPSVQARASNFPFVVVFPQNEDVAGRALTGWNADTADGRRALAILDQVIQDFRVDSRRVILTGWSMGGYGAWSLGAAHPERFQAVVPVAGGGDPDAAAELKDVPVWAFHGRNDRAVPVSESRAMVEALRTAGGDARYTEVAGVGHDVWRDVYAGDALYRWMLDPSAAVPEFEVVPSAPERGLRTADRQPFVPAVDVSRAVTVRLGNDVLDAIATSVPRVIKPDALSGRIPDITDSTTAAGRTFNVWFTNIGYRGELVRAEAASRGPEGVDVVLGVRNVTLTIGTTYVRGGSRSAVAGPIQIVIGHLEPVWLRMIIRPGVDRGRLRLHPLNARFEIPHWNWYVTAPAGISTKGLFFTEKRVSQALVRGLYNSKDRIEREVTAIVPAVLAQLEQQIDLTEAARLAEGFWPLPVYQPEIRVRPSSVSTDAQGITLVLDAVAGAVDPVRAPRVPRRVDLARQASPIAQRLTSTDLQVGLAPGMLAPLTQMLIDAGVASIHVQDIPGGAFGALADAEQLSAAVPELKRFGEDVELRSVMSLKAPIDVIAAPAAASATSEAGALSGAAARPVSAGSDSEGGGLLFRIPSAVVSVSVRDRAPGSRWQPVLECEFALEQQARATVVNADSSARALQVEWTGEPRVEATARFADGYDPQTSDIDTDELRRLFEDGWTAWSRTGPAGETVVADVDLGYSRLRLDSADVEPGRVQLTFAEPGIEITNTTDVTVSYQTKGADKPWGGPFRLEAGGTHHFDVAYPLLFRSVGGAVQQYFSLPAGSRCEFRSPAAGAPPRLFLVR